MSASLVAPVESAGIAITYLSKNATSFDSRFTLKVLRNLPVIRQQIEAPALAALVIQNFDAHYAAKLLEYAGIPAEPVSEGAAVATSAGSTLIPEVDAFIHILLQSWCLHNAKGPEQAESVMRLSRLALQHLEASYNRRSLDHFVAKIWFYYLHAAEQANLLHTPHLYADMMKTLRTAVLRHDFETRAMLIILLMRLLIMTNRVSMAANLVSKTEFPESHASNSLAARYYYYLARLSAIELDYSTSFEQITAAIRKVPQTPAAVGFLQSAHKLSVLVELLTGDIPPRKAFGSKEQPELVGPLRPYLALAKAVRLGDIQLFEKALVEYGDALKRDRNFSLARRLRQNVIKTGIRVISLTYSKISLKDICLKLSLGSEESAEYIVAKAIRDGVIDAKINHQQGYMQSLELNNVYNTKEPANAFHERIKFCVSMHDDNVKALRYLSSDNQDEMKDLQEAREREKELATEIQENTDLEDEDVDFDF